MGDLHLRSLIREQGSMLEEIRRLGYLDLYTVAGNPLRMGALAELEYAGQVLRAGEPDHLQRQPYLVADSGEQRKEFREILRTWNDADTRRHDARRAAKEQP